MTNEKYNLTNDQSEIFKTTVEVNSIANDVALENMIKSPRSGPKWIFKSLKNLGNVFGTSAAIGLDIKSGKNPEQATWSNVGCNIIGGGAGAAVGLGLTALSAPAWVIGGGSIAAMLTVGGLAYSQIDKNYKTVGKGFREIGKLPQINIPQMSSSNQNNNQSLFNRAKLYVQKNQKADITVPTAKELLNVSNSAAVQQAINQNNAVQVIETKSQPVVQQDSGAPGWLSSLYDFLNVTNVALGGTKSVSAYPIIKHTGGKVPGRGDIMAILKGGETVRTEVQEKELQEQMLKKHFESFAPLVSGQGDEQQNQQNGAFSSYAEKKSAKPVLQDRTRHDEEMIIGIVADAWKTNRLGFRRVLKAQ